ncbi:hypothetical protein ES319_A10G211000v1 [Gossypium barbadense]|uniref:t-SNARE coiled-coil homology domain-containing protein n=1 Tax=Gossypium barbadense TaxID=3634 RepID=A0A5J5U601_GOSBA|nr:hypothetical protein ES319_A10G211000v1 [Gossypium barbadense]
MSKARDPFYIVKEEIQESLQSSFHQWERILPDTGEQVHLTKELLANCEIIEWKVDELNKTIDVAAIDPSWYGIDNRELESRRRWTITARTQVGDVKKSVVARKENVVLGSRMRSWMNLVQVLRELEVLALQYMKNFLHSVGSISSISYASTLVFQEKIIDDLGTEMDSTTNRLDFVQKKVAIVMKNASAKGQIMMILFLLVLFIILFILIFLT